jgi:hypothetical protein
LLSLLPEGILPLSQPLKETDAEENHQTAGALARQAHSATGQENQDSPQARRSRSAHHQAAQTASHSADHLHDQAGRDLGQYFILMEYETAAVLQIILKDYYQSLQKKLQAELDRTEESGATLTLLTLATELDYAMRSLEKIAEILDKGRP